MKKNMHKTIKKLTFNLLVGFLTAIATLSSFSCNDDMPAESYYTFTGEMMSDFLKNNPNFSHFSRIVERAGVMDLLSARGEYTLFPPTNKAIELYLAENHYATVEDIPVEYCDTLAFSHLVHFVYTTSDFSDNTTYLNMLEFPLNIIASDSLDSNNLRVSVINSTSAIINSLKNDSVENGIIHPVDHVIVPNTDLGSQLLDENHQDITIYYEAMKATGLLDSLYHYLDADYEMTKNNFPETRTLDSGSAGNVYTAKRPDRRLMGYTVFAVPDKILQQKYQFDPTDMDACINKLYDMAVELYNPVASRLGITDEDRQLYWNNNPESFHSRKNPLNMFISYHMLDRMFTGESQFVNRWGVNTAKANPTEWISTMLEYSTLKIEAVYASTDPFVESPGNIYLNHATQTEYLPRVRGSLVSTPVNNLSLNCAVYYLDDIIAYDEDMQNTVMNTRIRTDFMTLFPELTTNGIRLNGQPWYNYGSWDNDKEYRYGTNYYIPSGYLSTAQLNENGIFFIMRPHNEYWNLGGDEVNLLGSTYDFTFRIPSVPPGVYEVRLGFTGNFPNRGIAQFYFDGQPQGIPIDMRLSAADPSIGAIYGNLTEEELIENNQMLKSNGYYRGPSSLYAYYGGRGQSHKTPIYVPGECHNFDAAGDIYRRVLCKVNITSNEYHTIRVRSVYTSGNSCAFMMDYLELVPNSICGVGGLGEDTN